MLGMDEIDVLQRELNKQPTSYGEGI